MRLPIALLLIALGCCTGVGQQSIGPNSSDAERFAFELTNATADRRAELLAAQPERLTVQLRKELIQHGNLRFAGTEYTKALEIYQLVEKISEQIGDKEGIATARLNIGSVYFFQGNYERAIEHYRSAETLFLSLNNRFEAARCHYGLALTYQAQRKPADALKAFEEALKEFQATGDKTEILNTLASIGGLQYEQGNYEAAGKTFLAVAGFGENGEIFSRVAEAFYMQHDYGQALVHYDRALELFTSQKSLAGTISALSGAANCYYYQRNYDRALEFYYRSLALEQKLNDQIGIATRLQNIGNVHRSRGDYGSALEAYFKSLSIAEQQPGKPTAATTLAGIGLVRAMQGDNAQAVDYFNRSLSAFQTSGDEVGMSRMLSYLGNARYVQGQYDLALEVYAKSLELHQKRSDHLNRAHVLLGIGSVYLAQQKYPLALRNFHDALALYASLGRKADMADALTHLAATYREQGDNARALEFAQNAARTAKEAEVFSIAAYALTETGRAQRALDRGNEALSSFVEAIGVQRSIRPETGPDGLETERSGVLPYLGAMETLIELDKPREALVRAEEAKSQFLREVIQLGNFTVTKGMTVAQRQEELKLLGELISLKVQWYGAQEDASAKRVAANSALRNRLSSARAAYEAFRKKLYTARPQLAVNRGEFSTLNPNELRTLINNNSALVEYAVTESHMFLFVVTANGRESQVKVYPLNTSRREIAEKIAAFRQSIDDSAAARELYDILLRPAETQIGEKTKLIIVPDGQLWDVPFEALQIAPEKYVIDRASISYAPSFSALREMRRRQPLRVPSRGQALELLVFSNPKLAKETVDRLQTTYDGLRLPDLSTETSQIEKLRSIYGSTRVRSYTDQNPTEDRLRLNVNTAGVLHFATPAILDHSVPMYSFLVLSPDATLRDDGLLRLSEVTYLDSKARIVILPYSSSAKQYGQSGNALIALGWAWFVAGTPLVVLNRWEMNDATDFVSELHQRLKADPSPEQFRQAILKLKTQRRPGQWAGYMFLGN
ncbi:MAG TPA: tetratricopeptide repeat protein [Pyrinomonadaceae bacterium]|jgi:tetratricopeptide (TPR) repeat protein|nr:tetratricopeptide repeat protein [Pyrinomonadaceae bacterium]